MHFFGLADIILDECRSLPSMEPLWGHFHQSRDKILTIVSDSLLLTQIKVEAEKFAQVPTSLSLALLNAKEQAIEFAKGYNVDIGSFPISSKSVIGEPELLSKVLEALLETGVRFSKPGSVIHISSSTSETGTMVTIETTGRLIPEKLIPQFFDVLAIGEAIIPGGDLGLRPAVAERIISLSLAVPWRWRILSRTASVCRFT